MVRPRKANKIAMTTISISEDLLKKMIKKKSVNITWYDFINRVYYEWLGMTDELNDREDTIENQNATITQLEKQIEKLTTYQKVESNDAKNK